MSNSSDLIYGVSIEPAGTFRYNSLNAAGERWFKGDGFRGQDATRMFSEGRCRPLVNHYRQCAEFTAPLNFDLLIPTPAGMVWFETALASLRDDSGDVTQIYAIARNITAGKADMEAMESLNRRA